MASNERPVSTLKERTRRSSMELPISFADGEFRVLVLGRSGHCQFSLSNSILREEVFENGTTSIAHCLKHRREVFDRKIILVNMPNLSEYDTSQVAFKKEFKRSMTMSCPGPHAVLFALDLNNISPSVLDILQLITQHFGDSILSHMIAVVCHEGEMEDSVLKEKVKMNRDFRELTEKCDQRFHLFNEKKARADEDVTRELLRNIDEMVNAHPGGFYTNPDYEDAEERMRKREKIMRKQMEGEMLRKLKELQSLHTGDELDKNIRQYETRVRLENREKAERDVAEVLGFTLRAVDYAAAVGKGAAIGVVCGAVMGLEGMAVGAVVGAVMGGVIGGAARAVWRLVTNATA